MNKNSISKKLLGGLVGLIGLGAISSASASTYTKQELLNMHGGYANSFEEVFTCEDKKTRISKSNNPGKFNSIVLASSMSNQLKSKVTSFYNLSSRANSSYQVEISSHSNLCYKSSGFSNSMSKKINRSKNLREIEIGSYGSNLNRNSRYETNTIYTEAIYRKLGENKYSDVRFEGLSTVENVQLLTSNGWRIGGLTQTVKNYVVVKNKREFKKIMVASNGNVNLGNLTSIVGGSDKKFESSDYAEALHSYFNKELLAKNPNIDLSTNKYMKLNEGVTHLLQREFANQYFPNQDNSYLKNHDRYSLYKSLSTDPMFSHLDREGRARVAKKFIENPDYFLSRVDKVKKLQKKLSNLKRQKDESKKLFKSKYRKSALSKTHGDFKIKDKSKMSIFNSCNSWGENEILNPLEKNECKSQGYLSSDLSLTKPNHNLKKEFEKSKYDNSCNNWSIFMSNSDLNECKNYGFLESDLEKYKNFGKVTTTNVENTIDTSNNDNFINNDVSEESDWFDNDFNEGVVPTNLSIDTNLETENDIDYFF